MKIAVISDIHANLAAMEVVLAEIDRLGADRIWCLGDVAGYGPFPNESIVALTDYPLEAVAGNHDLGVVGVIETDGFNQDGRDAVIWQRPRMEEAALRYLRGLSLREKVSETVTLVHGSPRDPVWEYLYTVREARESFAAMTANTVFFGHTHVPIVFRRDSGGEVEAVFPRPGERMITGKNYAWMINPGSVGQPRDGDPRASFLIYDDEDRAITYHRLEYDVGVTRDAIRRFGLPQFLGDRLVRGI